MININKSLLHTPLALWDFSSKGRKPNYEGLLFSNQVLRLKPGRWHNCVGFRLESIMSVLKFCMLIALASLWTKPASGNEKNFD